LILLGFNAPAYLASFLIQYFAAGKLGTEGFGLFYLAIAVSNILFSGSSVLNAHYSRYLATMRPGDFSRAIYPVMLRIEQVVLRWGLAAGMMVLLVLLTVGNRIGVTSPSIVFLIVVDVYSAYVADLGRVLFQSQRRTLALGVYTLCWMVLRFALCVLGIVVLGTAWGGMLGIALSGILMTTAFHKFLMRASHAKVAICELPPIKAIVPLVVGFGLLAITFNLDTIVGYITLTDSSFSTYSSSSVYPKALLTATLPLLQMLFSIMSGERSSRRELRRVASKTALLVLSMAVGGAGFVWLTSDWLCGGRWGLKLCQPLTMYVLLFSVVPLALIRVLLLVQFAHGRDWLGLWLAVPIGIYVIVARAINLGSLAEGFTVFSYAALILFGVVCLADRFLGRVAAGH
jgi:hypothetical protein